MSGTFVIGGDIAIELRRSARARRMVLRAPRAGRGAVLTLPPGVPEAAGRAFAESRAGWLRQAIARAPAAQRAGIGALIPVEGAALRVTPAETRLVRPEGGLLLLPAGRPAGPVLRAFLRQLAHERLRAACDRHAAALSRPYRALVLRDTRSRWGSCTAEGRLMFSWRLAMAPPAVLDYVAAHEVAHLAHMDHSRQFWAAVERLHPGHAAQRQWLRRHGPVLMAWQF